MSRGVPVTLSHPDKVLWPACGVTKADLADYLDAVADRMLPGLRGRPLTLKRFPDGIERNGFFQKNLPRGAPDWLDRFETWTPSSGRTVSYALVGDRRSLRWAANQNTIEFHPWFSRVDRPERPDVLAFDLDPGDPSQPLAAAAVLLRDVLDELGLASVVKTSGKRGLHVHVPVQRRYSHADLRGFGLAVARACAARDPERLTVQMRKAERGDRLLLDWSRNGAAQTSVAPWSPRAQPAGTVSMPLRWEEVTDDLDPTAFTVGTAPGRPDAWATLPGPQRIERAREALTAAGFPSVDRSPRARTG